MILLADYGGKQAGRILIDPSPLKQVYAVRREGGNPVPGPDGSGTGGTGRHPPEVYFLEGHKLRGAAQHRDSAAFHGAIIGPDRPCPTLLAGDPQNIIVLHPGAPEQDIARGLTPLEYERLMCLPDGWTALGQDSLPIRNTTSFKDLGNSIAVHCAEQTR